MTPIVTEPEAPEVNVMALVPSPAVMVPPVMVHAKVAPDVEATLAVFPVEFAHTEAGAAMAGAVPEATVTEYEALAEQPDAFWTVTE